MTQCETSWCDAEVSGALILFWTTLVFDGQAIHYCPKCGKSVAIQLAALAQSLKRDCKFTGSDTEEVFARTEALKDALDEKDEPRG